MNPRQRRGVLLIIATAIGALVVFVAVLSVVSDVRSQVGPTAMVLQLTTDVQELQAITPDMIEEVSVPERWISETAILSADEVVGKVSASVFAPGTTLQQGMLIDPPGLQAGYREVAILVNAETGVAGKVRSGDRVDILATTAGTETSADRAEVWVANALVLEVGIPRSSEDTDSSGNFSQQQGVPVTFALPVEDALRLAYAETFSEKLRLALRGRGDEGALTDSDSLFQPVAGSSS
ncbi:Flp pilus assembly protein CpaB [Pengzhenrongella frigida]|uniref:Flp pilus assembly protein CpaB n=1 Tax=Pengzhenrongella frigida TaxID=1259133 RepID=A0A4Q5N233_9MICO|nr:Flp pilus assembly protein CpaB [Cellulomonas sp. HLT2-17]